MNIVFDARVIQDHFPGIGRYAYNLLAELPSQLHEDEALAALHDPAAKNTRFALNALRERWGSRVTWVDYRLPVFSTRNVLCAPAFDIPHPHRDFQPLVVHYPYYVRPRASRPSSVTTVYDAISFVYPQYVPSVRARLSIQLLHQIAIGASCEIITISRSAADDLARFFPSVRNKLVAIPLAPDPVFKPQPYAVTERIRAKFNLPKPFMLYLASNKPHKNLERLVEAWRTVVGGQRPVVSNGSLTPDPRPLLVIAGHQDPRYPQAPRRVKELGLEQHVRFIGAVTDEESAALYSICDLFVYPSLYEGFGLTPLEAMACGAPVACSNTSSMPEVVADAALLFDPTKPEEIASVCLRALRDDALRTSLRERSLQQAARFSWRDTARLTIGAYREVAGSQAGSS